jgi:hypothetical protein
MLRHALVKHGCACEAPRGGGSSCVGQRPHALATTAAARGSREDPRHHKERTERAGKIRDACLFVCLSTLACMKRGSGSVVWAHGLGGQRPPLIRQPLGTSALLQDMVTTTKGDRGT